MAVKAPATAYTKASKNATAYVPNPTYRTHQGLQVGYNAHIRYNSHTLYNGTNTAPTPTIKPTAFTKLTKNPTKYS